MSSPRMVLPFAILSTVPLLAQQEPGELFDRATAVLERRYHDRSFRQEVLPVLAERFRSAALRSETQGEERAVLHALLARIPASHLALYSQSTYRHLLGELDGDIVPTLGMRLRQVGGRFFAVDVLEGGPAARAGVLRGDRVLTIDGLPTGSSPRRDWRSDDAALPDPPSHGILAEDGEVVVLEIERAPGSVSTVEVECADYSAWQATIASVDVIEHRGNRIGYLHLHYIYSKGGSGLVRTTLADEFADCDGWILDLRGRGGSALEALALVTVLERAKDRGAPPMVALVDAGTRSAKEVISYRIRRDGLGTLVGERTAGAVLPASFARLGPDDLLMYPEQELGRYSDALEGKGVVPDVSVPDHLPYAAGSDPILATALEVFPRPDSGRGGNR